MSLAYRDCTYAATSRTCASVRNCGYSAGIGGCGSSIHETVAAMSMPLGFVPQRWADDAAFEAGRAMTGRTIQCKDARSGGFIATEHVLVPAVVALCCVAAGEQAAHAATNPSRTILNGIFIRNPRSCLTQLQRESTGDELDSGPALSRCCSRPRCAGMGRRRARRSTLRTVRPVTARMGKVPT